MRALSVIALAGLAACSNLTHYEPQGYIVRSGDTLYSIAWRHGLDHRDLARWNGLTDPNRIVVGQRLVFTTQVSSQPASRPGTQSRPVNASAPVFSWPSRGNIVARFGERGILTTGIGIAGRVGQEILAAAPGRVVYAGDGLPDYGQLAIIEHNESWLTAYGHNRSLAVAQGQTVSRGQKIGEMGLGPGREPRLYFEIRRNGDPLDPLGLLPDSD